MIAYIRVSTDRQGESGLGLEAQRTAIDASRYQIDRYEIDVLSGRTLKRPGLLKAVEDCKAGNSDGIIVAKLDRLSRSLIDFAGLLSEAKSGGWNLVALDLGVDLTTPSGEFLASVMAACAQWESQMIGQRVKEALAVRKRQGVKLGRPYSIPDIHIARIKEMRKEGYTLREICKVMDDAGIPTPRGGAEWRPSSLQAVL
jgi:DNA invertase Pin-like site-specific DNA recombinase